ncbi:MAG: penicillin acylase family protein [Saprospiraceae bacterium]
MRYIKFLLSLALTVGLVHLLSNPQTVDGNKTPAFGNFLNPFSGFWQNAESLVQKYPEITDIEGFEGKASVVYDDRLVPHIFAENDNDLAFMQGYVVAQHRLWQMEFQTHAMAGRLTEIIGERALEMDRENRRMGLPQGAKETVEKWKKSSSWKNLQAYVNGINAYINQLQPKDYPLEYKLLGYKPEQWTALKTALFVKAMSNTLARQDSDIEMTNLLEILGREQFDFLYPEWYPQQSPIIPKGTKWNFNPVKIPASTVPNSTGLSYNALPKQPPFLGSNNWAVAGSKTLSGNPILCGDPHLKIHLPSIWFEMQLSTSDYNVYGVTLPGIPNIIIGFNDNIAWTQTNVSRDILDWYTIEWKDEKRLEYKYDGEYRKVELVIEEYKVRNGESILDTIRYTHHGPVVFEDTIHAKGGKALRWLAHDAPLGDELDVFWKLPKADNYGEFVEAIKDYHCPAQNYCFAGSNGDIGLWCQGTYPLKSVEQGRFVLDGTTSATEWKGFIPQEHNPHVYNPRRGFVSSANQHSTDPTYPYYYSGRFADYRGRYINSQLTEMDSLKRKDLMNLQTDNYSLFAAEALPLLIAQMDSTKLSASGFDILEDLKKWNFRYEKDLTAPTFFNAWYDTFFDLLWDEILKYKEELPIKTPELWRTIALMRDMPLSPYFDIVETTTREETFADVAMMAFQRTVKDFGGEVPTWRDTKSTNILHLAGKSLLPFGHTNIDVGGNRYAPNAITGSTGPSWRMVVELGKTPKAYGVYPGGQSGNPGSKYYDNFIEHWRTDQYYELSFMTSKDAKIDNLLYIQEFE